MMIDKTQKCSFCGKWVASVNYLIAGPDNLRICDECVDLCNIIINEAKENKEKLK